MVSLSEYFNLLYNSNTRSQGPFISGFISYTGNDNLHKRSSGGRLNKYIIFGLVVGAAALIIGFITSCLLLRQRKKDIKRGNFSFFTSYNIQSMNYFVLYMI